ncbi:MAG: C25 family cysteine peptidase [candidate division WOR-3 bacterium]
MLFVIGTVYNVDFNKVSGRVEIPNFPIFKVEIVRIPLNPGESLKVDIISYERLKTTPKYAQNLQFMFDNLKYFSEPEENIPDKPIKVVYGFSRGKKFAFVSFINLVRENGTFYEYKRIRANIFKIPKGKPEKFSTIPLRPTLDMVIITDSFLVQPFESLAVFRTLRGIRTKVFTLNYIYSSFPGRSYEEKIRNFIKYAYTNWGIRFVLIGGSREVVPAPRIEMASSDEYNYGTDMQSDAYYSALDGDWNYNGNYLLGELSDTIDIMPDVAVGRIPITDPQKAFEIVRRIIFYETHYLYGFQPKILLHASKFIVNNDACGYVSIMRGFVPSSLNRSELCEQDTPIRDISMSEFVDSLQRSTIFWGFSHSNYRVFLVNIDSTTVVFTYNDIFRIRSDSTPVVWLHTGCLVNSPNNNSIGAMLFKEGKSIVSYGPQKESAPSVGINLVGNGLEDAYNDSSGFYAGLIDFYAKTYAASLGYIETYVYEAVSYGLIGDPATLVYKTQPYTMSPTVFISNDTLYISGAPSNSLVVAVQGGVEILRDSVSPSGGLTAKLNIRNDKPVLVGINAFGYLPKIETLYISSLPPILSLKGLGISSEYAGTPAILSGYLKNPSSFTAISPFIKFVGIHNSDTDSTVLPDINPGDSVPFNLNINISKFAGYSSVTGILIYGCSGCDTLRDTFTIMGKGPKLKFVGAYIDTSGGSIALKLLVYNEGGGPSDSVFAELYSGPFTMVSPGVYTNLPPLRYSDTSFKVILSGTYSGGIPLRLKIYNDYGDTIYPRIVLPSSTIYPPIISLEPGDKHIKVVWSGSANGYIILRDTSIVDIVPGNWSFIRDMLSDNGVHCYRVVPVKDGVVGIPSPTVCNRPNPERRFAPKDVLYTLHRTIPLAAQLDRVSPEYEVVFSSLYNTIFAFDHMGNLLWKYDVDTFPDLTEISAPPAVGDINGDRYMEVVFGISGTNPGIIALDHNGNFLWKYNLPNAPTGPVVLGLYRGGRVPAIAFRAGPNIYFLNGSGGLINSCGSYQWRDDYMSAGDLDRDGTWELVFLSNDTVYAINTNCNNKAGFPKKLSRVLYRGTRLYDVNGDGYLDIIVDGGNTTVILDRFGNVIDTVVFNHISNFDVPITLDWDGDGVVDIGLLGSYFFEVRRLDGTLLYMQTSEPNSGGRLIVAGDLNGDGRDEAIFSDARSKLHALGAFLDIMGFPINLGHGDRYREEVVNGGTLVYDIDEDGDMEMFAATNGNKFYGWNLGITGSIRWPMVRGNRWNSGFPSIEMPDTNASTLISSQQGENLEIIIGKNGLITVISNGVDLEIYDITGRRLVDIRLPKGKQVFKPGLKRGVYFLKVKGKNVKIKKFII